MILGILGSIFGIIGGLFAIMVDGIGKEFGATDSGSITGLGVAVIITCIITLVLSCIINKKSLNRNIINHRWYFKYNFYKLFGILSGILILVAGILALIRK